MSNDDKIRKLEKLIAKASDIKNRVSSDPEFKSWKYLCERTLCNIYGEKSKELEQFNKMKFYYSPSIYVHGNDYSQDHLRCFNRDFDTTLKTINLLLEELKESSAENPDTNESSSNNQINKIFISHSSKDKLIVEDLIDIFETIGINSSQIFCSSFDGYGIPLGKDFLETIREEIGGNVFVIFVLSHNFYSSEVCLCEMGATWVLAKESMPILIPPFTFDDVKGVFPLTQGMIINDELKFNLLKDKIIKMFGIPDTASSIWERKRDRIITRINKKIIV